MGKLKTYAEYRLHENLREYDFYYRKYKNMLFNKFSFKNLPNGISEQFIKETLFTFGFGIFYVNKYGFLHFSKASKIDFNDYNEPIGFHTESKTNNHEYVKAEDCVIMYNNEMRLPSSIDVHYFSKRLSDIDKTILCNMEQLKNSMVISCPEGQKKTIERLIEQKKDCEPYIIVESSFSNYNQPVNFFATKTENICLQLEEEKKIAESQALTFFGINNVNINKKERLITNEVDSNNEEIALRNDSMLDERIKAIDNVNKKFGCDIKVLYNTVRGSDENVKNNNNSI